LRARADASRVQFVAVGPGSTPVGQVRFDVLGEEAEIEIRPLFELDDFAEVDPTGELRRKEKDWLAAVGARH